MEPPSSKSVSAMSQGCKTSDKTWTVTHNKCTTRPSDIAWHANRHILVSHTTGTLQLFEFGNSQPLSERRIEGGARALASSSCCTALLSATAPNSLVLLPSGMLDGEEVVVALPERLSCLQLADELAIVGARAGLHLVDLITDTAFAHIPIRGGAARMRSLGGCFLAVEGVSSSVIQLCDVRVPDAIVASIDSASKRLTPFDTSPADGHLAVCLPAIGQIALYDTRSRRQVVQRPYGAGEPTDVALAEHGQLFVCTNDSVYWMDLKKDVDPVLIADELAQPRHPRVSTTTKPALAFLSEDAWHVAERHNHQKS